MVLRETAKTAAKKVTKMLDEIEGSSQSQKMANQAQGALKGKHALQGIDTDLTEMEAINDPNTIKNLLARLGITNEQRRTLLSTARHKLLQNLGDSISEPSRESFLAQLQSQQGLSRYSDEDTAQKLKEAIAERDAQMRRALPGLLNPFPGFKWPLNIGDTGSIDAPKDDPPPRPTDPGDIIKRTLPVPEPWEDEEDEPEPGPEPDPKLERHDEDGSCIEIVDPKTGTTLNICQKDIEVRIHGKR